MLNLEAETRDKDGGGVGWGGVVKENTGVEVGRGAVVCLCVWGDTLSTPLDTTAVVPH